ncbi:FAD-dependent monooxygenase [Kitasatospora sp. NBC_01287]|uniref:FAD-dependent monooxygenase n=1 Tax=Kitasatospora sp. NBC_01287 TaxID=2903573 RepID=UPI0022563603|nr:FAD-dependent monooxygenase [Kitasatospora sp. NBC_01287]MCX4745625.1 FAD-dependent monooxygenase [Kitasatospora sp. NBC_01287]
MSATVTVVGAGPVGLSAALAAHALGERVTLLEAQPREATARPGSRAIFVHRATLERLERVSPGLGERIAERGLVWRAKRTRWAGREVYAREYRPAPGPPPFTSLPQTVVEDLLRSACDAAGITAHRGDPVAEVLPGAAGVEVRAASGAVHLADHVIAADGPRSTVRERLGIALSGTGSATGFVVVDVAADIEPADAVREFHYRHPAVGGRNVLLVPFRGGWRVDVQARPGEDAGQLLASAADWLPGVLPASAGVPRVTWSSVYRFQQRLADAFTDDSGRVLLAGEAAHLLPPFGARGMNSGIADAVAAARAIGQGTVPAYAEARRAAAQRNIHAAGAALDHLLAARPGQRLGQWAAAAAATRWPRAGRWLDSAPYGPRLRTVEY